MEHIGIDILLVLIGFIISFALQKLFPQLLKIIPFAIVAGFVVILIKIFGFRISEYNTLYTDIFLAFIFGSFPLTISTLDKKFVKNVLPLWRYSLFQYLIQWGGSIILVTYILKNYFNLGDEFGSYLPSGFAGGHGSAAVVGDLLQRGGITDALSYTMFCATAGILFSVFGGIILAKVFKRKYHLKNIQSHTAQNFHFKDFMIICVTVIISFILKPTIYSLMQLNVPGFVTAVLIGFIMRMFFGSRDQVTLGLVSTFTTDLLVIIGMGSINFLLIKENIFPLIVLFSFGLIQGIIVFLFLSKRVFQKDDAFEKALFTWGWSIGGLVIGLNLVQSLEKKMNPNIIEEFAMTYLILSPFEISLLVLGPWLLLNGFAPFMGPILLFAAIILLIWMLKKPVSN